MLKHNINRFKKRYFLSSSLHAIDYKWYFCRQEFDGTKKIFLIAPSEWNNAINRKNITDYPNWFDKLKRNHSIMVIIKSLKMVLLKYEIKLIQTTYFSWGKKQVHIEDYWTFYSQFDIIMEISWWSLSGETTFYLINPHIENIMLCIDVMKSHLKTNKSITTQLARTLMLSKVIANVVKIQSIQDVFDKLKNEELSIQLVKEYNELDSDKLVEYLIQLAKQKFSLKVNLAKQHYHFQYIECYNDYIQFDLNYMSTYSFKQILNVLANNYTSTDYAELSYSGF